MSISSVFAPLRFAASVLLAVLLVACGRSDEAAAPEATVKSEQVAAGEFGLTRIEVESFEGRPAALLSFSKPLAAGQKFDELLVVTGDKGATVEGSWVLDLSSATQLRFPYLDADRTFRVRIKPGLAAADGATLAKALDRELYTGPLEPLLGFASQGSVLPAHERRGLPIVSVNVPEVDVEFLKVREADLGKFLAEFTSNGRRSYWSLDQLAKFADPVYATRFAVESAANQRTLTYLPVRDIGELKAPGIYFAVMKRPGNFTYEQDTAMFFVTDIGLHVRAYADHLVVHAASLESGEPLSGVHVEVRNRDASTTSTGDTDGDGLARLGQKLDATHVLVATKGDDVSVLPFNQPALDLSEFAIAGRPQRAHEVFPWSGRDLYRPGELLKVAALLRDADGKSLAQPQPLFATLKQPDGRTLVSERLEPGELGYYAFERRIAPDAPTGRWSLELSTDPTRSAAEHAFSFRVEEFLPERLKLELGSAKERLAPGDALPLTVDAAYLYGAPAAGNRFTAKTAVSNDEHPIDALRDFHFGDPLAELPKEPAEEIDTTLDENGHLEQDIALLKDYTVKAPVAVIVNGSVYETGGRAVSRTLKRTIWPADTLVGVRPLFDLAEGSPPHGNARFEVVRTDPSGALLAADGLEVRLVREWRDYHWTYDPASGWRSDYSQRFETAHDQELSFAAGARGQLQFPVEWGGYRVEIDDPATGLTTRLPFEAGWGWDNDNRGTEARPDKVKLALDKTHYRGGETLTVTVTPPHAGPALLMLEAGELLWKKSVDVTAGTTVEIPIDPEWERHDLYLTALVFRPGSSADRVTPNRAVGIAHVAIDRSERTVAVELASQDLMRPHENLNVAVKAPQLAGRTAHVRVTAVDLGVLNITRYPLPDAAKWFFAQRRLGVDAYDLYARVIESLDGDKARLRYGGDAIASLPGARRPDPNIEMVDLFHAPVALDADGKATVAIPVPDFNGTLRVRALVYSDGQYGAAERDVVVRAPLVVEASTPRVMAPGDVSKLTIDVQNLSGASADIAVELAPDGPVALERTSATLSLADQAKETLQFTMTAREDFGVGRVRAKVTSGDTLVEREFRFVVRPAHPAVTRSLVRVYEEPAPVAPEPALLAGLYPASIEANIALGTLPPLPFAQSVKGLIGYPYGCIEQTTSRAHPLVHLDDATAAKLGLAPVPLSQRAALLADAFTRITAMQNDTGHFGMWPGDSWVNTQMTPYVAELLLDARDNAFTIPEPVLTKALDRINEELLSGGNGHYEYDNAEHLRLAEMAFGGYVLARVQKAPLGTLRAMYDNERKSLKGPLPLVHLAIAFKLMGDTPRAEAAVEEAFTTKFERPGYLGDYGSELRDLALMVALTHEYGLAKPEYDAKVVDVARELLGRGVDDAKRPFWLSTQEQMAIFRLGKQLLDGGYRTFSAQVSVGGTVEELTGQTLVSRSFGPDQVGAGVRIVPRGEGPLYLTLDVAGYPRKAEPTPEDAELRIKRAWYRTDGTPWDGTPLGEGDVLVAHIRVESGETMNDALVVDLVPGGLEIENLNLTDASQWDDVTIDGIAMSERTSAAEIRHEEYRDDRYVAALKLYDGSAAHLFYLVRAVSPGTFVVPPPSIEDMYRPQIRAVGVALPEKVEVGK